MKVFVCSKDRESKKLHVIQNIVSVKQDGRGHRITVVDAYGSQFIFDTNEVKTCIYQN